MQPIGFMQGRLSEKVDGKIQAFPWKEWRNEFPLAGRLGFPLMEWTLDQDRLHENPLMTNGGRREIRQLSECHGVSVRSLTGDCFMQFPFYKEKGKVRESLVSGFLRISEACAEMGIRTLVVPLVDNGRIENEAQQTALREGMERVSSVLRDGKMAVAFESDFPPERLKAFIESYPDSWAGINYDIGNSASLGFDPVEEIRAYGQRILNVHVKDRLLGGTTVPLGNGNANFPVVFNELKNVGYSRGFILQTARAVDDDHGEVLSRYRDMVRHWLNESHGF
jgi:L-ribulose-5-phosphate 3-epimerase